LASAASVTPSDRVTDPINVRDQPTSKGSEVIGALRPGEQADLLETIPRWYMVQLADGTEGYVSKAWTDEVSTAPGVVPFEIHFVDVGVGDAAIVDMGWNEIVIDGGNYKSDLETYENSTGIIDGPIELGIVTHSDSDHWKGFERLFNLDGRLYPPDPAGVLEAGLQSRLQASSNL